MDGWNLNSPPPPPNSPPPPSDEDWPIDDNHPPSPPPSQGGGHQQPTPPGATLDGGASDPTSPAGGSGGGGGDNHIQQYCQGGGHEPTSLGATLDDDDYDDYDDYDDDDDDDDSGDDDDDYSDDDDDGYSDDDDDGYWSGNYCAYPLSHIEKTHLEAGNKIILPLSALDRLMDFGAGFPMLFELKNPANNQTSHCGVLEFTAEEGVAVMPDWMISNISLEERGVVNIKSVTLETATYLKLQPHSVDFLDIRSPKEVLEASFCAGYSCLTVGDTIVIMHGDKKLYVDIVDAKPSNAVCILDTDCEVDFATPLDYKEPEKSPQPSKGKEKEEEKEEELPKFVPFSGRGRQLVEETSDLVAEKVDVDVVDSGSCEPGKETNKFVFGGNVISSVSTRLSKPKVQPKSSDEQSLKPFTGKKYRLTD